MPKRQPSRTPSRSKDATSPAEISQHGWRDVLRRSAVAVLGQEMSLAAAGIAFYMLWALFPALAVLVMLAALFLGRTEITAMLGWVELDLPKSFNVIVVSQLDEIARHSRGLSIATVLGALLFAIWGGMRGARALITALNLVYREEERRTFWQRETRALVLCLLGGAFLLGALALILGFAGTHDTGHLKDALLAPSRWPILIATMMLLLSVAYRHGPCRRAAKWRWVTWGAAVSATIWVLGSAALSYWAAHHQALNPVLGSLASVMLFLFWAYLTVVVILLGAVINAELEQHTAIDTTVGTARPRGQRGARVADTLVHGGTAATREAPVDIGSRRR